MKVVPVFGNHREPPGSGQAQRVVPAGGATPFRGAPWEPPQLLSGSGPWEPGPTDERTNAQRGTTRSGLPRRPSQPRGRSRASDEVVSGRALVMPLRVGTTPARQGDAGRDARLTEGTVLPVLRQALSRRVPARRRAAGVTGRLLTARELGDLLGVSAETVLRWTRRGELPAIKLPGGAIRYQPEALEAWLDEHATAATPGREARTVPTGAAANGTVLFSARTVPARDDEDH